MKTIRGFKMSGNISIFLASDDNYAPYLCTTMYSILKHTKSKIDFYIMDGGIRDESKELIKSSLKKFDSVSLEYIDMDNFELSRFPNIRHYSVNAFSRYFIPVLKPEIAKALYLDVDVIVKGDISELYNQDLGTYPLGAVLEDFYAGNYTYLKDEIFPEYEGGSDYFNSGVLLIDCDKFREHNYTEKLVDYTITLYNKLACADQDVYNIVFQNNFKIFDYKFNFMPDYFEALEIHKPDLANYTRENALVLHYTSGKPWHGGSVAVDDFWQVARMTSFADKLKNELSIYQLQSKVNILECKLSEIVNLNHELHCKLNAHGDKLHTCEGKLSEIVNVNHELNNKLHTHEGKLSEIVNLNHELHCKLNAHEGKLSEIVNVNHELDNKLHSHEGKLNEIADISGECNCKINEINGIIHETNSKVVEHANKRKKSVYRLFNMIPLLKIYREDNYTSIYLFGCILIMKIK